MWLPSVDVLFVLQVTEMPAPTLVIVSFIPSQFSVQVSIGLLDDTVTLTNVLSLRTILLLASVSATKVILGVVAMNGNTEIADKCTLLANTVLPLIELNARDAL